MFVILYNAAHAGVSRIGVLEKCDADVLSILDQHCPYSLTDSVWIPPCCWEDHE